MKKIQTFCLTTQEASEPHKHERFHWGGGAELDTEGGKKMNPGAPSASFPAQKKKIANPIPDWTVQSAHVQIPY